MIWIQIFPGSDELSYFKNLPEIAISFEQFDKLAQKLVWIIDIISWRYLRCLITAPPSVPENLIKEAHNSKPLGHH